MIEEREADGDVVWTGPFAVGDARLRRSLERVERRLDEAGVPQGPARWLKGPPRGRRPGPGPSHGSTRGPARRRSGEPRSAAAPPSRDGRTRPGVKIEVAQGGVGPDPRRRPRRLRPFERAAPAAPAHPPRPSGGLRLGAGPRRLAGPVVHGSAAARRLHGDQQLPPDPGSRLAGARRATDAVGRARDAGLPARGAQPALRPEPPRGRRPVAVGHPLLGRALAEPRLRPRGGQVRPARPRPRALRPGGGAPAGRGLHAPPALGDGLDQRPPRGVGDLRRRRPRAARGHGGGRGTAGDRQRADDRLSGDVSARLPGDGRARLPRLRRRRGAGRDRCRGPPRSRSRPGDRSCRACREWTTWS